MKKAIFTLLSTKHGPMILSMNDHFQSRGLLSQIAFTSENIFQKQLIIHAKKILKLKRKDNQKVLALDIGANFGIYTLEMSNYMNEWGHIISFEAQEKVYYALCGNIAINNCLNVSVRHSAVGSNSGYIKIPKLDYSVPTILGSFSIKEEYNFQDIGQNIDYKNNLQKIKIIKLDDLNFKKVDFIKIDVEGMEIEVILGSERILHDSKPVLLTDVRKIDVKKLYNIMKKLNYVGVSIEDVPIEHDNLFFHRDDPCLEQFLKENKKCIKIY